MYRPSAVNLVPVWQEGETGQQGSWVMSDATVEIKSSAPTIEKTVKEGENYGETAMRVSATLLNSESRQPFHNIRRMLLIKYTTSAIHCRPD